MSIKKQIELDEFGDATITHNYTSTRERTYEVSAGVIRIEDSNGRHIAIDPTAMLGDFDQLEEMTDEDHVFVIKNKETDETIREP